MSEYAIEMDRLTKVFGKGHRALDDLTLRVPVGSVFGFLGPNGAGKTTALRILAGLSHPTTGHARIFGQDSAEGHTDAVRAQIGFLPDVPGFYPWMNARRFLEFAGDIFGLKGAVLEERIDALLDLAGLAGVEAPIKGYSRGMKQRLGLAQALINSPHLLMLDEPTSALDPLGRKEVLDMVAALRGRTTVFFSTHILADVERVCDTVAIINLGRLVTEAPMAHLKRQRGVHRVVVDVDGGGPLLRAALSGRPWLAGLEQQEEALILSVSDLSLAQREIPAQVSELGLGIRRMEIEEPTLEEVFVELVKEAR